MQSTVHQTSGTIVVHPKTRLRKRLSKWTFCFWINRINPTQRCINPECSLINRLIFRTAGIKTIIFTIFQSFSDNFQKKSHRHLIRNPNNSDQNDVHHSQSCSVSWQGQNFCCLGRNFTCPDCAAKFVQWQWMNYSSKQRQPSRVFSLSIYLDVYGVFSD